MNDEASVWLTSTAYRKLEEELELLTTTGRLEAAERIAEARSHGDIRENAEYDAAKNDQGLLEARIRRLQHTLDTAEVGEAEDTGVVTVGSVVTVRDEDDDEMEILLAPTENRTPGLVLASPSSPLGAALLESAPGDDVTYEAPGGTFTYRVLSIRPHHG